MAHRARDPISGEVVDSETGEVIERPIDLGPEWRVYEPEEVRRVRAGAISPSLSGMGLGTENGDDARVRKALAWARRLAPHLPGNRALLDRAATIIRKACAKDVWGGDPRVLAVAALLLAARERGIPMSLDDVKRLGVSERGVYRCMARIVRAGIARNPFMDPRAFLYRVAGKVGAPEGALLTANMLLAAAIRAGAASGRKRVAVAAAALYIVLRLLGVPASIEELARAAGVSAKTVSDAYKKIVDAVTVEVTM